jgi:hypothetical protein
MDRGQAICTGRVFHCSDQAVRLGVRQLALGHPVSPAPITTLLSSGLEDYFLGTYYFNRGRYANALAGLTHLDTKKNTFSAYRFHDDDPVFFQKGLRLTCRCGEELNGKKLHDPPDTQFTTYTWIYQW